MNQPTLRNERLEILDILRGLAILFIFIANIKIFSFEYALPEHIRNNMPFSQLNGILGKIIRVFVDGKFYSVFSILFGIGFALQYNKFRERKEGSFPRFFSRRMTGLLLIGFLHLFLIWFGDILFLYALMGFVLIPLRNLSQRKLLYLAIVLLFLPVLNTIFFHYWDPGLIHWWNLQLDKAWISFGLPVRQGQFPARDISAALQSAGGLAHFKLSILMPFERYLGIILEGRAFKVLGCFILGYLAGQKILKGELLKDQSLVQKIILYGFLVGLPANIFNLLIHINRVELPYKEVFKSMTYFIGVVPLAMAYCGLILVIWKNRIFERSFRRIAAVGRTALSNYVFQSLVSVILFYNIGAGLGGSTGSLLNTLVVLLIFMMQVHLSTQWLNSYRFGPLEWLWRQFTYARRISLQHQKEKKESVVFNET